MEEQQKLFIKQVLAAWNSELNSANKLLSSLTDEQLTQEVAPKRNTGVYLLGHLTAVHDGMLPLMGYGEKLYPQLEEIFIKTPDKSGQAMPSIHDLREQWDKVNAKLSASFNQTSAAEWFQKHTAVSAEDFAKEPHRNKLNIVIGRANHLAYHRGQLAFLNK